MNLQEVLANAIKGQAQAQAYLEWLEDNLGSDEAIQAARREVKGWELLVADWRKRIEREARQAERK